MCRNANTSKGYVYFMQIEGDGPIKIGWAKDPKKRLREVQRHNPHEVKLRCMMPGGRKAEHALHRELRIHRMKGEWFQPHNDVIAAIANIIGAGLCQLTTEVKRPRLPKYVRVQRLADGSNGYFWTQPTWVKNARAGRPKCPIKSRPLGRDPVAALAQAHKINQQFDEWKKLA